MPTSSGQSELPVDRQLVEAVRTALTARADHDVAAQQRAYMKSQMPFHGVRAPQLRQALRPLLAGWHPDRSTWEGTLLALWDEAGHREERYAATALARHRLARVWLDPATLPLWRHLVVSGAWWDHVDEIAAHLVGGVLRRHRSETTPVLVAWAHDPDLWLRRTAVLAQLRHGGDTDTHLLRAVVEVNLADDSFWLRKAIGWALRHHARTDPAWVRDAVEGWGERLSPLSRREALKHLSFAG